ncbi:MAG: TIGR00645 family protein [Opitutaceae bacterium]|nr:TIGR00645 family protein [Opitutaceae bacterium]
MAKKPDSLLESLLERSIFASRWLQAPLYVGLILAQCVYVYQFFVELWHLLHITIHGVPKDGPDLSTTVMLMVLGLIDVVMIANLLIMVIIGGYETFVSRLSLDDHADQPEWLNHVNAGVLKVKLATALISISSIHLLKTFITVMNPAGSAPVNNHGVMWQVIIHLIFVVSAIALAWTDKLMMAGVHAVKEENKDAAH